MIKSFMAKIILVVMLGCGFASGLFAESPIWAPPFLEKLIVRGLNRNNHIKSAVSRLESLERDIPFAASLEDPRLGMSILNLPADTGSFKENAMTQKQLFLAQKIPLFGKLSLKERLAALKARRQKAVVASEKLKLAVKIAWAYYDMEYMIENLNMTRRFVNLTRQMVTVAEAGYAGGRDLQKDILQVKVKLSTLRNEEIVFANRLRMGRYKINELLNEETFQPLKSVRGITAGYFKSQFNIAELKAERLLPLMLKKNPELAIKKIEKAIAGVEVKLAQKAYWPNLDFKVAYGRRDDDAAGRERGDLFSASAVINIPLWQKSRQDARLSSAKASENAAVMSFDNLRTSLPHRLDALLSGLDASHKSYLLLANRSIREAQQWSASVISAYEVGQVDFDEMINARLRVLQFKLQARKYLFDTLKRRAELEQLAGGRETAAAKPVFYPPEKTARAVPRTGSLEDKAAPAAQSPYDASHASYGIGYASGKPFKIHGVVVKIVRHTVKRGQSVSTMLSRIGKFPKELVYNEFIKLFNRLNPDNLEPAHNDSVYLPVLVEEALGEE